MNPTTLFIAVLVIVPAAALVTWAWLATARFEEELRSFDGFQGMHFEV